MSIASKKSVAQISSVDKSWQDRTIRSEALTKAVSLVHTAQYDPKNIVKDAQVFYQFLKGT